MACHACGRDVAVQVRDTGRGIRPEDQRVIFDEYRRLGLRMGFQHVEAGPLVRSSYHADNAV